MFRAQVRRNRCKGVGGERPGNMSPSPNQYVKRRKKKRKRRRRSRRRRRVNLTYCLKTCHGGVGGKAEEKGGGKKEMKNKKEKKDEL